MIKSDRPVAPRRASYFCRGNKAAENAADALEFAREHHGPEADLFLAVVVQAVCEYICGNKTEMEEAEEYLFNSEIRAGQLVGLDPDYVRDVAVKGKHL